MRSNIAPQPPRLDLRAYSNSSIQINQYVSVVSTPQDEVSPGASFVTVESMANGTRPQTNQVVQHMHRWDPEPKLDRRYNKSKMAAENPWTSNGRESMLALSEFLKTKDPPPSNWISFPSSSDDDESLKSATSKLFGRKKSKKSKKSRVLKLPDSAVAARTSSGSRHIAISIPLQGWPDEKLSMESALTRPQSQPKLPSERPAVTVLKPVAEARESPPLSSPPQSKDENGKKRKSQESDTAADILGIEAARTLESYYTQLNRQQKRESMQSTKVAPSRSQRRYVTIPPLSNHISRQNSQRTSARHSVGTLYSTTGSLSSPMSHSRGVSSASTAPSATAPVPRKLDYPPRNSSLSKVSPMIQAELAQMAKSASDNPKVDAQRSSMASGKSADGTIKSDTSVSQSPLTFLGTTDSVQSNSIVNSKDSSLPKSKMTAPINAPKSLFFTPSPTKELPDIPVNEGNLPSRTTNPSPVQTKIPQLRNSPPKKSTTSTNSEETTQVPRQSRQDRVKARKSRDMAILGERNSAARPEDEACKNTRVPSQNSPHITSLPRPQTPKARSSSPVLRRKATITFSPIMVVATTEPLSPDLRPPPATCLPAVPGKSPRHSLAPPKSSRSPLNGSRTPSRTISTPPRSRSATPSFFGSDSDTLPTPLKQVQSRVSDRSLDVRRQERRTKRNLTIKEKELDARLKKIEKDNMVLRSTLSGIATSFQELNRLYAANGAEKNGNGRTRRLLEDGCRGNGGESGEEAGLDA